MRIAVPASTFSVILGGIHYAISRIWGSDRGMTPVGEGQIDFAAILAESETAGLRHYFVEHDHPEDALASIQTSITHLRSLTF